MRYFLLEFCFSFFAEGYLRYVYQRSHSFLSTINSKQIMLSASSTEFNTSPRFAISSSAYCSIPIDFLSSLKPLGIQIYSTAGCKYCRLAKATLLNLKIPFTDIDINVMRENPEISTKLQPNDIIMNERIAYTMTTTVPQIYIENEYIGGCDALLDSLSRGELQEKLNKYDIQISDASIPNKEIDISKRPINAQIAVTKGTSLNSIDLITFSSIIHSKILKLTDTYVSADGLRVEYSRLRLSQEFQDFIGLTMGLQSITLEQVRSLSQQEIFCFFVNLYNALIIHATCVLGPPADSPESRTSFFTGKTGALYHFCGFDWSPDDIEHGILRANFPRSFATSSVASYFSKEDPRTTIALKSLDPRVHFILNCGAQSCPPIKVLIGDPEAALSKAAAAYLKKEIRVDSLAKILFLPRLALWYGQDFGSTLSDRVKYLISCLDESTRATVLAQLHVALPDYAIHINEDNVEYNKYEWISNGL